MFTSYAMLTNLIGLSIKSRKNRASAVFSLNSANTTAENPLDRTFQKMQIVDYLTGVKYLGLLDRMSN